MMDFDSWGGPGDRNRRLRWLMGHLDQRIHVEDKADPAIAENCATGQQILLPEGPAEALDHHLLFADEFIHEQAPGGVAGFDHDDDAVLGLDCP